MAEALSYHQNLELIQGELNTAYAIAEELITADSVLAAARRVARVYRPSGSVAYSLGPELGAIVAEFDEHHITYDSDYKRTRNPALIVQGSEVGITPHFVLNHGDEVSYDVKGAGTGEAEVTPLCAHRQDPKKQNISQISFPGIVLRTIETASGTLVLEQVATGQLVTDQKGKIIFHTEHGPEDHMRPGDRVVFNPRHRLELDSKDKDTLRGVIDNTMGVAGGLLVARTLGRLHTLEPRKYGDLAVTVVITDLEEGLAEPPFFGGGARDLAYALHREGLSSGSQFVVHDGHDFKRLQQIPDAGLYTRVVSSGRGAIMQPDRVYRIQQIAAAITRAGGKLIEDGEASAVTSRSDDQDLRNGPTSDRNIWAIGYGVKEPHHNDGKRSEASLANVVAAARALVVTSVIASKGLLY